MGVWVTMPPVFKPRGVGGLRRALERFEALDTRICPARVGHDDLPLETLSPLTAMTTTVSPFLRLHVERAPPARQDD